MRKAPSDRDDSRDSAPSRFEPSESPGGFRWRIRWRGIGGRVGFERAGNFWNGSIVVFFKEHVGSFFLGLELCSVLLVGLWLGD